MTETRTDPTETAKQLMRARYPAGSLGMFFDRANRIRPPVAAHLARYLSGGKPPADAVAAVYFRMIGIDLPPAA